MYIIIDNRGPAEFSLRLSHTQPHTEQCTVPILASGPNYNCYIFKSSSNECVQTKTRAPVGGDKGTHRDAFVVWQTTTVAERSYAALP